MQKVVSFLVIPLVLGWMLHRPIGRFGHITRASVLYGVWFGFVSMVVIGLTYWLLRESIDWEAIQLSMESRHINEMTFLLVFAYIMFGNSLTEEYFFRGVVFHTLRENSRWSAYLVSAGMFSLYHITIFGTWFSGWILGLALFGLCLWSVFFSWLYEKTGGIWGAWIFHIFADLAILVIGYMEFFM